ncbi:MAG TPA: aminopeptidase [Bryobacteraceae bacterium]|nr:aminopeptidase [Bryobacteraceae bacterium]
MGLPRLAGVFLAIFLADGHLHAQTTPNRELIDGMKDFESKLGFPKTRNFGRDSETLKAYYRCYYTGPLELPDSYDGLKLRQGRESGCGMDPRKFDVFFYAIEAVASGKTPVTTTLASEPPERVLVVVSHEDYHARKDLPPAIAEAAATLVGFLTAADYARQRFGADAPVSRNLEAEAALFLRKAELVNRYYAELRGLYDRLHAGAITRDEAFAGKARVFTELRADCRAMAPDPHSFNKCLGADNNAGLAFDRTYTQYYPLFYELFAARGRDARATIQTIDRLLSARALSEEQAAARIRTATGNAAAP